MEEINKCSSHKLIVCLRICKISVADKYMQANSLAEDKIFILSARIFACILYTLLFKSIINA